MQRSLHVSKLNPQKQARTIGPGTTGRMPLNSHLTLSSKTSVYSEWMTAATAPNGEIAERRHHRRTLSYQQRYLADSLHQ